MVDEIKEVVIPAEPETVEKATVNAEDVKDSVSPQELEMMKKHGLIETDKKSEDKKDDSTKDKKQDKTGNDDKTVSDIKSELEKDLPPEKEHELLSNYNKNERGLYWKMKEERQKRQLTERENELLRVQLAAEKAEKTAKKETKEKSEDDEIDDLFNENKGSEEGDKAPDSEKLLTKKDLDDHEKAKEEKANEEKEAAKVIKTRVDDLETMGKTEHPEDWENLCSLAKEVMEEDMGPEGTKSFYPTFLNAVADTKADKKVVMRLIEKYARLNDKFGKEVKKESKANVEKILENQTRRSSASLGGGKTERKVSLDNLTLADTKNMSVEQWGRLPKDVRDRILKET